MTVDCQGSSGLIRAEGDPSRLRPSDPSLWDHIVVGVERPWAFWSDFHNM